MLIQMILMLFVWLNNFITWIIENNEAYYNKINLIFSQF